MSIPVFSYGDEVFALVRKKGQSRWSVRKIIIDSIEEPVVIPGLVPDPVCYNGIEEDSVFKEKWRAEQECYKRNPKTMATIRLELPMCCSVCQLLDDTMLCKATGRFAECNADKGRASFCPMIFD